MLLFSNEMLNNFFCTPLVDVFRLSVTRHYGINDDDCYLCLYNTTTFKNFLCGVIFFSFFFFFFLLLLNESGKNKTCFWLFWWCVYGTLGWKMKIFGDKCIYVLWMFCLMLFSVIVEKWMWIWLEYWGNFVLNW